MAIDVTFPTINFPHRGEFERSAFVAAQETAQDTLADEFTTALNTFKTQANELEINVTNKEANVVEKHDIVVAKEALMSPHYTNIDIVAENIGTIGSKIGVDDIHNATPKSTPVDADEFALLDSATSFSLKKLTFANLWNYLSSKILSIFGKRFSTAWVNFDGTTTPPTIRDSYNVSSVVRSATGVYDVYFTTPMDNVNYSIASAEDSDLDYGSKSTINYTESTVSKFRLNSYNGSNAYENVKFLSAQVFGGKN